MKWLDSAIEAVAPRWAAQRAFYRVQIEAARGYDAGKTGRRQNGRSRPATSANAEIGSYGTNVRNTARELVRNNPLAKKAKRIYVANLVGTGIVPTAATGNKERDKKIDRAFAAWCREADAAGRLDFYGIQAVVGGSLFESGEVLARFHDFDPGPALRLQVLEADHLDTSRSTIQGTTGGAFVDQGIERDIYGRPLAYWLYPQHPGDSALSLIGRYESVRITADQVAHVYAAHMGRPGQARGISEYAAVAGKLGDLAEFDDATLVGKKVAACFGLIVKRNGATTSPLTGAAATTDANSRRLETLSPGMVQYLGIDEDVETLTPPALSDYGVYTDAQHHAVAAGLGVMYEHLTGDLSKVNYSSYRAGQNDFRRAIEMDQWLMLIPLFCEPVWRRFIDRLVIAGQIRPSTDGSHYGTEWATPRWESVDPAKDAAADRDDIRAGLVSLKQAIARRGYNPDVVLAQIAETNKLLDQLELTLDTDPRKVSRAGGPVTAQDGGPNAGTAQA